MVHDFIDNSKAVILEATVGNPMWFCYYIPEDEITPWHRVATSEVETVSEQDICLTSIPPQYKHEIIVTTNNSIYRFVR